MKHIFAQRQQAFEQQVAFFQQKYNQWAVVRAVFFVSYVALLYGIYTMINPWITVGLMLGGMAIFLWMITKHLQIKQQKQRNTILAQLNWDEQQRLEGIFVRLETGENFLQTGHFYATDIDLFGKQSLFSLLNRTHTYQGAAMLAHWLQTPAHPTSIAQRHEAIAAMTTHLDWRQLLEATALEEPSVAEPTDNLLLWAAQASPVILGKKWLRQARFLPFVSIPLVIASLAGVISPLFILLIIVIHGWFLKQIAAVVAVYLFQIDQVVGTLKAYATLCRTISQQSFQSAYLQQLQADLAPATTHIATLEQLLARINNRQNPIFQLSVGLLTLWDLQYMLKLEKWRKQHAQALPLWLENISTFEALNSLAGHAFANPQYIYPTISQEPFILDAKGLGHPLIKAHKRVCNDITLKGLGKTIVITGSNMSGKSTFQRTVASNVVLALMGAVIHANSFVCSPMQVFTSMRTQDSLAEDTSSFYAELKRLAQLIQWLDASQEKGPTLYFLDEILKGTNSKDRHDGARALLLQLHTCYASGFISTHDVALGEEFEQSDFVENYSFSSEVTPTGLLFDYTLRKGICHSFNASALMQQIGIRMEKR